MQDLSDLRCMSSLDSNRVKSLESSFSSKSHGRLGNPKTHTGCKTCKLRRVKCDETTPHCLRCVRGKRECLGYDALPEKHRGRQSVAYGDFVSPLLVSSACHAVRDDDGLFQFFITSAASGVSGLLDGPFWTRLLPQISHSWTSVRCSLLCLSAILRDREGKDGPRERLTSSSEHHRWHLATVAAKFYSKAVRSLSAEISKIGHGDVVALTSVIFFCIEALQGDSANAMLLYRKGLSILEGAQGSKLDQHNFYPRLVPAVEKMFARIRLAVLLSHEAAFNSPPLILPHSDHESLVVFEDICASREALLNLTAETYEFHRQISRDDSYDESHTLKREFLEIQMRLIPRLEIWRQRSTTYLSATGCSTTYQRLAQSLLQCHYVLNSIWLRCAASMSESRFDDYNGSFAEIVALCSEIVHLRLVSHQTHSPSTFQLESGMLLPLYVTACKCRDPSIREAALHLLKQCPSQEGLWLRSQVLAVASRVAEIENVGSDRPLQSNEELRIRSVNFDTPAWGSGGLFRATFRSHARNNRGPWTEWLPFYTASSKTEGSPDNADTGSPRIISVQCT